MRRTWIKIFCDQWLRGSIRQEKPEIRAIFTDLLAMAGDSAFGDDGIIQLAIDVGFNDESIAGILNVPLTTWIEAKKRLSNHPAGADENRIIIEKVKIGFIIKIITWTKYQSEYGRQKKYRKGDNDGDTDGDNDGDTVEGEGEGEGEKKKKEKRKNIGAIPKEHLNEIMKTWNTFADHRGLAQITGITETRKRYLNARFREHFGKDGGITFVKLLEIIDKSPFLLGKTKAGFFVTFDWIIRPTNFQKIIEGNYLDRKFSELKKWLEKYK